MFVDHSALQQQLKHMMPEYIQQVDLYLHRSLSRSARHEL